MTPEHTADRRRVVWGGILAGLGLGGFSDGIVLHQILQWHHLVSNVYPVTTVAGLERKTLGDGLFHAASYLFTAAGLFLLWGVARRRHEAWPARQACWSVRCCWAGAYSTCSRA